jgi:hypothetical protein
MRESNPIATAGQADIERLALRVLEHPLTQAAQQRARAFWLDAMSFASAEMRARFEAAFEEVVYCAAVWSLNLDPERPRVSTITRLEHRLGGLRIPGSRYGIENPDTVYRTIPVAGDQRYLIKGKVAPRRLPENYFTLWDANWDTVGLFNGKHLQLEADGSFTLTVDSSATAGRANHIQLPPSAHLFYIRDVVADWNEDTPNQLSIERLGAAPSRAPLSEAEQAGLTAGYIERFVRDSIRWNQPPLSLAPNTFPAPIIQDKDGWLRNQAYALGRFLLRDDEALVLTVHTGGADYFILPICNLWGTTNAIVDRLGSLNRAQSVANADGSYTFVVSLQDPGVHNWLDPSDLHEGVITARWAEFAEPGRPAGRLAVDAELVPLARLRAALPAATRFVTAAERGEQLQRRARGYARRLAER